MAWYDPDPQVRRRATFVAGVATGALLLGLLWVAWSMFDPGSSASGIAQPRPAAVLGISSTDQTSAAPCRAVYQEQVRPLEASTAAMRGWRADLGTVNQLVAGEITAQKAIQSWERTSADAATLLDRYDAAAREFSRRTIRCPRPVQDFPPAANADTCPQAVAARSAVLRLAARALATWRQQVDHMEMVRMGTMTPAEATLLWQESRQRGDTQLRAYDAAVRSSQGQTC
jgi:hypothetical protein